MFLLSIECDANLCSQDGANSSQRAFNVTTDVETFAKLDPMISDSVMIAPFDVNEDGKLDVICQYLNPKSGKMDIKIIFNNVWIDSFFLKAMMAYDHTDRVKTTSVVDVEMLLGEDHVHTYGDNVIGATFRFVITKESD